MSLSCKFPRAALFVLAVLTGFLPFAMPEICAQALQEGLALCTGPLLLSLFPFLIVSTLLVQCEAGETLGKLMRPVVRLIGLRSDAAGGVLLIGLLGGFAPAAAATAESVRRGSLSPEEASALLPACICSGPSFVILTVGGQFLGSSALGVRLFLVQVLAGYLTAALLNRIASGKGSAGQSTASYKRQPKPLPRLDSVIADAAVTYLKLCGFVLYFRLLSAGLSGFLPLKIAALPAIVLEVSSGCELASRSGAWASALCCAALSLQGASVLLQVRTICPKEVSFRPLLAARLLHLPIALSLFCLSLPEQAQEAFSTMCSRVVTMRRVPVDCALLVFFGCCLVSCELCRTAAQFQKCRKKVEDKS